MSGNGRLAGRRSGVDAIALGEWLVVRYLSAVWGFQGVVPALFSVGTKDALLNDALFLHARWAAAGHEADLAVYPGGPLGFTPVPNGLADKASVRKWVSLKK